MNHTASAQRVYSFDILKFLAICAIVLHHYQQVTHTSRVVGINWYGGSFYWGNLVELFFIISGFFAFRSIARIKDCGSFYSFYSKKYFRFLPMLIICGIVCLIVQICYARVFDASIFANATFWNVAASLFGIERWLDTALMVNNPMWYISVLLLCLAVFFVITKVAVSKDNSPLIYYGIAIGGGLFMKTVCESYSFSAPLFNTYIARGLICFFLGLVIALAFNHPCIGKKIKESPVVLFASIVVTVGYIVLYAFAPTIIQGGNSFNLYYSLCFIFYPCLMLICNHQAIRKITSSDRLSFLGGVAYNMYVWHVPLIVSFMALLTICGISFNTTKAMYLFLLLCFVFGCLSNRFIDKPIAARINHALKSQALIGVNR